MPTVSNFPSGFSYGVNIREIPVQVAHPGKVFWVNNSSVLAPGGINGSDGNNGTYTKPFASIAKAISMCLAGRGDIIMVMPGHIEAVTATSVAMNVQGVAIIGLGEGDLRPTFNFGATASSIVISAADCSIINCVFAATINAVVAGINIQAEGITLNIETKDTANNIEFISPIVTTSAAKNLNIKARHRGWSNGSSMTRYIDVIGVTDAVIDLNFYGKASVAVVSMRTTASANIKVTGKFYNSSAALIKNVTDTASSTWSVWGIDDLGADEFAGSNSAPIGYISTSSNAQTMVSAIKVIPQTASTTVFTVSGGPILLEYLAFEVTTVVQTQACNFKFTSTDTASSTATDLCANLSITGQAVGTFSYVKMDALATALTAIAGGTGLGPTATNGIVIPVGTVVATTSASNTGNIKYHLRWRPLDPNAQVVMS